MRARVRRRRWSFLSQQRPNAARRCPAPPRPPFPPFHHPALHGCRCSPCCGPVSSLWVGGVLQLRSTFVPEAFKFSSLPSTQTASSSPTRPLPVTNSAIPRDEPARSVSPLSNLCLRRCDQTQPASTTRHHGCPRLRGRPQGQIPRQGPRQAGRPAHPREGTRRQWPSLPRGSHDQARGGQRLPRALPVRLRLYPAKDHEPR